MNKLAKLTQAQLDELIIQARTQAEIGKLPEYIPLLSNPNRSLDLAIQVYCNDGQICSAGAGDRRFPFMSLNN